MYVANVNSTMHDIVYNNRELYHGERWWQDQRYYAPMATIDNTALFVRDRVLLHHPVFGDTVCTVKQFYMEVTLHLQFKFHKMSMPRFHRQRVMKFTSLLTYY